MNWKLVLQLSLFGLAMSIATVYLIPTSSEPFYWVPIFLVSAYVIATRCRDRHVLHGVMVGIVNSFWITSAHVLLFDQYIARHPQEATMLQSLPMPDSPRLMMAGMGPVIGVLSGVLIGLLAGIAARFLRNRAPA
jgi:hypothetical protein